MRIERVIVGDLRCNCYILSIDNEVLIIDPGGEFLKIKNKIGNRNVLGIIITHYHFDHIGALEELRNEYKCVVYDINNLSSGLNRIGDFSFETIHTLGHKDDLITIYFKDVNVMFCGDFIFKDSIGRCDLPGGSILEMQKSIKLIKKYDDDIIIYPGHGDKTTLGYEKENNIYFK